MDWESAKKHCVDKNWHWSLAIITQAQEETKALEDKIQKLEENYKTLHDKLHNL